MLTSRRGANICRRSGICAGCRGDLGHNVESSVFGIVDIQYRQPTYPAIFANRKGLLRTNASNDVTRIKRACYAVQNVAAVFDSQVARVKKPAVSTSDPGIQLYEYKAAGGVLDVPWLLAPPSLAFREISFPPPAGKPLSPPGCEKNRDQSIPPAAFIHLAVSVSPDDVEDSRTSLTSSGSAR